MSKKKEEKKEEWNPFDTMSEEYMESIKSDVDFGKVMSKYLKKKRGVYIGHRTKRIG
ncbi:MULTISPECIES: hypothetical protein [Prevotellaceae]|uniref:hypothetical protein n=1 Tax=Prevotellaceae TaxID=171552 RepID=UPI0003D2E754|nr:hypothetical protein [Prevotella phocaeensis]ETD21452.1 hypothetical protein HMPREF1199_00526 [Hoylesella oralis CC98A]